MHLALISTAVGVRAWMSDYTSLFYVDVIAYPCSNLHAGSAKLC